MSKNKIIIPLVLIGAGVAGYAAYKKYVEDAKDFLDSYSIRIKKIGIDGKATRDSSYLSIVCKTEILLTNPTGAEATLKRLALSALQTGKKTVIGKFRSSQEEKIKPKSQTLLKFTFSIPTLKLATNIKDVVDAIKNKKPFSIDITGEADFGVGKVKINETVKVI